MVAGLAGAVVDHHVETSRKCHYKFLLSAESVTVAKHTAGHVVNPIGATNVEG